MQLIVFPGIVVGVYWISEIYETFQILFSVYQHLKKMYKCITVNKCAYGQQHYQNMYTINYYEKL